MAQGQKVDAVGSWMRVMLIVETLPSPFPFLLHWLDLQAELHLGNPCSRKLSPSASGFFLIPGFVPKHLLSIY